MSLACVIWCITVHVVYQYLVFFQKRTSSHISLLFSIKKWKTLKYWNLEQKSDEQFWVQEIQKLESLKSVQWVEGFIAWMNFCLKWNFVFFVFFNIGFFLVPICLLFSLTHVVCVWYCPCFIRSQLFRVRVAWGMSYGFHKELYTFYSLTAKWELNTYIHFYNCRCGNC